MVRATKAKSAVVIKGRADTTLCAMRFPRLLRTRDNEATKARLQMLGGQKRCTGKLVQVADALFRISLPVKLWISIPYKRRTSMCSAFVLDATAKL
jgi:hypothetical protein